MNTNILPLKNLCIEKLYHTDAIENVWLYMNPESVGTILLLFLDKAVTQVKNTWQAEENELRMQKAVEVSSIIPWRSNLKIYFIRKFVIFQYYGIILIP